jgi:hypothetical protein
VRSALLAQPRSGKKSIVGCESAREGLISRGGTDVCDRLSVRSKIMLYSVELVEEVEWVGDPGMAESYGRAC